jgi:predicted extracellular nuclease
MGVQFPDKLVVSEYFEAARYGQITLTETSRPFQYTHNDNTPTAAEYQAFLNDLDRRRIILDDDDNIQNSALTENPQRLFYPQPNGFRVGTQGTDFYRGGDSLTNLTGVLHWSFAGQSGTDAWRIRPTAANPVTTFTVENPRPFDSPEPGGNIKISTFNVLNYFTSIDNGSNGARGADSAAEFERQNAKLLAALEDIDADVFGLVEIENNGTAVAELTNRLNARVGAGTYDYVNTGVVGTDQITVAIIYKPGVVQPSGSFAALTAAAFTSPNGGGQRNRPALAQTFLVMETGNPDNGAKFTVVVNHLKSKSPGGASGADADQLDGQAAFNDTRRKAAAYLVNTWIPSDPTGQSDPDFLILGDLNAYRGEDPIDAIKDAGYTDLIERFNGSGGYSYVFDGQLGYLDHALANASANSQVVGASAWHVNADEVPVFDYNDEVRDTPGEGVFEREPNGNNLYEPNEFRTSDHDPVVIGLDLTVAGPTAASASISGRLKTAGGADISGASVALFDTESGETINATTDIEGVYIFAEVPVGRDYIVTPLALGFSFNPSSRYFSLTEELTTVDFVGMRRRDFRKFRYGGNTGLR